MKTLLCVILPICCKLSCYDDVGFFAKEKCEKSKKLNVKQCMSQGCRVH